MASILFKVVRNCNSQLKWYYLRKDKLFFHFLVHLWILHEILNTLKEKMIVIANVFPKLQTVKSFVRKLSQEHSFSTGFGSQLVKASQMLPRFCRECIYHVFLSFSVKLIWKMFAIVLGQILGVFVNTLTADGKYPVQRCEKFQLPIQMQLSEKRKSFS